jgi:hypothetical protein
LTDDFSLNLLRERGIARQICFVQQVCRTEAQARRNSGFEPYVAKRISS